MGEIDAAALIRKAMADDVFRVGLARDFEATVSSHNLSLTTAEKAALSGIDWGSPLPTAAGSDRAAKWVHIYAKEALEGRPVDRLSGRDIGLNIRGDVP